MGELEQRALGIFVKAPEIYVSLWAQSGETGLTEQQFQDLIDMGEEGRTQLLQQNKEFSQGIVEFYKQNQEMVNKALEQTTSQMFKKGGKLAYGLEKFKCGGKTSKKKVKKGAEGMETDAQKQAKKNAVKTESLPNVSRREIGIYSENGTPKSIYEFGDVNGNTAETWATVRQPGDTLVTQRVNTNYGPVTNTYTAGSPQYESIMGRLREYFKGTIPNRVSSLRRLKTK